MGAADRTSLAFACMRAAEAVEQADERVAVGDVAGAIDQRVVPSDQVERHGRAEIACVDGHPPTRSGRQLGRHADEHRDLVVGGDRLAKHVPTEGPGGTRDEEAGLTYASDYASSGSSRIAARYSGSAAGCGSARARFISKCHFQIS